MKPLMSEFMESPLSGPDIEQRSFDIIDAEAPDHTFSAEQWRVVQRMIHTVGDFAIMQDVAFSDNAIASAVDALKVGAPIYTDSNMIRSGLSLARLKNVCANYTPESIQCYVADGGVAEEAKQTRLPRSLFAVRKAKSILHGGIAVFGNAPVGLMELSRLVLEENVRPALVIGMPVGFVHVVESKEELMSLGVPYIALKGRRGGSPLAVSVVHALCSLVNQ